MVGVAAFLASVWRGRFDDAASSSCAAAAAVAAAAATVGASTVGAPSSSSSSSSSSPPSSRAAPRSRPPDRPLGVARKSCVTLTLPAHLFAWLSCMAAEHNLGSVHKSVRALLAWAAESQQEDLDWIFGRAPGAHVQHLQRHLSRSALPGAACAAAVGAPHAGGDVPVQARLSATLQRWIERCVTAYKLDGPSQVLDAVCRCAIELDAAEDIFESYAPGHDLPRCTADLYYDLGIKGFSSSPAVTPPVSPQPAADAGGGWS